MKNQTRTLEQVEAEIEETKKLLSDVHGTETEVYARIVGYYRAVKHWNKGKADEFKHRKLFVLNENESYRISSADSPCQSSDFAETTRAERIERPEASYDQPDFGDITHFELYTRKTCPNCPPVKEYVSNLDIEGESIDVDSEEGFSKATRNGVFASPTVIFYGADGTEKARAHSVQELEEIFQAVNA